MSAIRREVRYLRRIVSAGGYRLDLKNVQAFTELAKQKPRTLGDIRRLFRNGWIL